MKKAYNLWNLPSDKSSLINASISSGVRQLSQPVSLMQHYFMCRPNTWLPQNAKQWKTTDNFPPNDSVLFTKMARALSKWTTINYGDLTISSTWWQTLWNNTWNRSLQSEETVRLWKLHWCNGILFKHQRNRNGSAKHKPQFQMEWTHFELDRLFAMCKQKEPTKLI